MRIGINTRFLLEGKLEGLGRYSHEIVSRLVKNHPEHQFIFFFDRSYHSDFIYEKNVEAVVVGPPARHPYLWSIWFEWSLPRAIKKHKVDYFISPDSFLSLRSKVPQHLVIHDLAFEHYPEGIPKLVANFYKKNTPKYCKKANRIISVSSFTKQDIVKQYGTSENKIDAVLNGVTSSFRPLEDQEIIDHRNSISKGQPYFVYVGAMHPRKNIEYLLLAYDQFKKETASLLKLVLIGRKAWQNEAMEKAYNEMQHQSDVIFTGRISDKELANTLGAAYALTYVPFFEGFGLPIIEAQSCGIPVITSDSSSMPEVLGEGGLLVNPNEVDEIKHAMIQLLDESFYKDKKEASLRNVKRFSWDKAAEEFWSSVEKGIKDANI